MSALAHSCAACGRPAGDRCPRCDRPLCAEHRVPAGAEHCQGCEQAIDARVAGRAGARVAAAASAAVAGMVSGALAAMLLAGALGLGPELIILFMLVAQLGAGGAAADAMDRRARRWLRERARRELGALPEARLLERTPPDPRARRPPS